MAANDTQNQLVNLQAQQLAAQVANWAAQLEFQKERMRLLELPEMQGKLQVDIDKLAWQKATDTWDQSFKEASITGTYKGQPTLEWLTQQAQMTGVLNGQQTLQGKLTDAQINQMNQQLKLANDQFVTNTTGYYNGQKTFDRQKFEAGQAQDAWKFLSTLTGPANAFKQAKAIGNMPGGLQGVMGAWAGQYSPAGFGAVGSGGQASMEGLLAGGGPGTPYYYPPYGTPGPPGYGGPPGGGGSAAPPPGSGPPDLVGAPSPVAPSPTGPGGGPANNLDEGFYVWLSHHGVNPGDPAQAYRIEEYKGNYMSLPQSDHDYYINAGRTDPANHTFDLSGWNMIPGLPAAPGFQGTAPGAPYTPGAPPGMPGGVGGPGGPPVPPGTGLPSFPGTPGPPSTTSPPGAPPFGVQPSPGTEAGMSMPMPTSGEMPPPGMDVASWLKSRQGDQQGQWALSPDGSYYFTPGLGSTTPESGWYGPGGTGVPGQEGMPSFSPDTGPGFVTNTGNVSKPTIPQMPYGSGPPGTMYALNSSLGVAPAGAAQPQGAAPNLPMDSNHPYYKQLQGAISSGQITADQAAQYWSAAQTPQTPAANSTPYSYQPAGVQAPHQQWNYSPTPGGNMNVYPPGVTSNYSTPDISSAYPMSPQTANNLYQYGATQPPEDTSMLSDQERARYKQIAAANAQSPVSSADFSEWMGYQGRVSPNAAGTGGSTAPNANAGPFGSNPWTTSSMPAPGQIDARAYANTYQYNRDLAWAGYEDAGYDKGLAQEAFARSLPKAAGPKRGSFAF